MREFLDDYVDTAFDGEPFSPLKCRQFESNYRAYWPQNRESALLDVGIGRGEMLDVLKQAGYARSHGIDVSSSTVAHCRARGLSCEQVDDCTAWLNAHPGEFALILLLDVIEHFEKPALLPLMRALHVALAPGGTLIVQTPNLQAPEAYLHRYMDLTHHVGFSEHSLRQLARVAGFQSVRFFGFETMIFQGWATARSYADLARRASRAVLFPAIRLFRLLVGNPNPRVLHPVLSAVMVREE